MIQVEQNVLSGVVSTECPHVGCGKTLTATTITRYYCIWCSRQVPNYRLLVNNVEERINYHLNGKVFNVAVPS